MSDRALPVLLGEAPSRGGDRFHHFPLSGPPARVLCQLAGLPPVEGGTTYGKWTWALYESFECRNVFERYRDATPWSAPAAASRVAEAEAELSGRIVVCLGRRPQAAAEDVALRREVVLAAEARQERHRRLSLDVEAHELVCGKCGQRLDPFDFLLDLTSRWERFNSGYRAARQQERAALARVENLKRLERLAKARIRGRGVVLTTAQARVVANQLFGLQYALIELAGGREEAVRLVRLKAVDGERLREATEILREQLSLDPEKYARWL